MTSYIILLMGSLVHFLHAFNIYHVCFEVHVHPWAKNVEVLSEKIGNKNDGCCVRIVAPYYSTSILKQIFDCAKLGTYEK